MQEQSGQGTVEWIGIVLVVAIALVALAGGARRVAAEDGDRGLGEALVARIAAEPAVPAAASRPSPGRGRAARVAEPRAARATPASRQADAFQRLRGVGGMARRAWILCLGYGRWRWELDHPRAPLEPMSVAEALGIANRCLNPLSFLFDG